MLSVQQLQHRYSIEQTLIILLCRLYFEKISASAIQKYTKENNIDWLLFYQSAQVNNIRGFLYHILASVDLQIDDSVLNRLKADASDIQQNNLFQLKVTRELLRGFKDRNIRAIPYKGIIFSANYYKKPFTRESSDIDFLVSKEDIEKAIRYLEEQNYRDKYKIPRKYLEYVLDNYRDLSFNTPVHSVKPSCSVEIQWSLVDTYFNTFPGYDFFSDKLKKSDGDDALGLTETYDFICVSSHHLLKEPLFKLKYLIDLACMVNTAGERLNFEEIENLYLKLGYERFLYAGSTALSDILGIQFGAAPKVEAFYTIFLADKHAHRPIFNRLQLYRIVRKNQSIRENIKFIVRLMGTFLRPNINDLLLNFPLHLMPLLFIVRPFRLMNKYIIKRLFV